MRARIGAGGFPVGAHLPTENAMAVDFGVSRTVIREALSRLKSEGLLEARQGSGIFVCAREALRPLRFDPLGASSPAAMLSLVELRRAIEVEAAALAAQRRTAVDIARMRTALDALDDSVAHGDAGVEEGFYFHYSVVAAAHNPYLAETLAFLRQYLHASMRVTRASEATRDKFTRQVRTEHQAVVAAIVKGDAALSRKAALRHFERSMARMRQTDPSLWIGPQTGSAARLPRGTPRLGGIEKRLPRP